MPIKKARKLILAFNRGVVSALGLARIDLNRMGMSAETQTNWMPRVLGSMMLRPGLQFLERLNDDAGAAGRLLPFTFGVDDQALLELSPNIMAIRDPATGLLLTRAAVSGQLLNTGFGSDIANWTDDSDAGGTVAWQTGGYAALKGSGTDFGKLNQTVTLADSGVERWLLVRVTDGPVRFKIGSSAGDDDYFAETRLDRGEHHLSFTPTANWTVEFANEREFNARVTQCTVQTSAGDITIATPWTPTDMPKLRWDQSADVIYVACDGVRTQKIERRGNGNSWSVVDYLPENGPFRVINVSGISLTPSALNGDITLTASDPLFKSTHADNRSIWRIASEGQKVTEAITAQNTFSSSVRVTGVLEGRVFSIVIAGSFTATVTVQYSVGVEGSWVDLATTYAAAVSTSYDDGQDNQIIYYRIGVKTGDFSSGTVNVSLNFAGGSIQGIARVYEYTSATSVKAHVLKDFGATDASRDWWEGEFSDRREWPTATSLHEGRNWWLGRDKVHGSVSDQYEDFDDNVIGDAGPISRSIGFGPIAVIHWALSLGRLLMGTAQNSANIAAAKIDGNTVIGARSSSFGEPLSPSNFNLKNEVGRAVFVDRTKQRLYELAPGTSEDTGGVSGYESADLSVFAPDFNEVGITQIAVQMKPDIRIHCVRSDGTVGVLVFDRLENVICWVTVDSDGATGVVEDIAV
ncbi:MAG TPA: hypothetical protein ENH62_09305, partial [Marinobacter sp.]|nr:hypothetical protein [Marinobacter sp.]